MRIFVSYGDEKFSTSLKRAGFMARLLGRFDKIYLYGPNDIDDVFKSRNKEILSIKRGAGLWLWKPYILYKAILEKAIDGDIVFYCDAGSFFIRSVSHIERSMDKDDIWVSEIPFMEGQFTKEDTFSILDIVDNIRMTPQIQASCICVRRTPSSIEFIKKWLDCCCNIYLLHPKNLKPGLDNKDYFISHREDQSILSLICKKNGIVPHQDPTLHGKYPELYTNYGFIKPIMSRTREYPVCIILHRSPCISIKSMIKNTIISILPKFIGRYLLGNKTISEEDINKIKEPMYVKGYCSNITPP